MAEEKRAECGVPTFDETDGAMMVCSACFNRNAEAIIKSSNSFGDEDRSMIAADSTGCAIDADDLRDEHVATFFRGR